MTTKRMVCVWLPHLPIERLKRECSQTKCTPPPADRPFALVGSDVHGLTLTAVNGPCLKEGLHPGMRLADARAIFPKLLTASATPEKDERFLQSLARWSCRYSPSLNVDGEDGIWLDITGIAHLFGGEPRLLADLKTRLARVGLSARLGAAETLGTAHALARFADTSLCNAAPGTLAATLAPLPVEALRLEPATIQLLRRLGLKRIGQLYDLPRGSLERRFHSKEAAKSVLRRLDEALGRRQEKRIPLLPEPDFVARLVFDDPLITHEGIVAGLDSLAQDLCGKLDRAGAGTRRVVLWAARTDGSSFAIEAGLSAPSSRPAHLVRLLKNKIEDSDMGFGDMGFGDMGFGDMGFGGLGFGGLGFGDLGFGVDLMSLAALLTEPLRLSQASLTPAGRKPGPEDLIDALTNRLGKNTVLRLFPNESHIPELAQDTRSAFSGLPAWVFDVTTKPPRPQLLLARPEPVAVMAEIPEGPPARFIWRRVSRRVTKAQGPERIAPEWWRALGEGTKPAPRDYYRIEDEDGCRYWVFRAGLYQDSEGDAPCWFLHGVFP